jgi:hypothetical protein
VELLYTTTSTRSLRQGRECLDIFKAFERFQIAEIFLKPPRRRPMSLSNEQRTRKTDCCRPGLAGARDAIQDASHTLLRWASAGPSDVNGTGTAEIKNVTFCRGIALYSIWASWTAASFNDWYERTIVIR